MPSDGRIRYGKKQDCLHRRPVGNRCSQAPASHRGRRLFERCRLWLWERAHIQHKRPRALTVHWQLRLKHKSSDPMSPVLPAQSPPDLGPDRNVSVLGWHTALGTTAPPWASGFSFASAVL